MELLGGGTGIDSELLAKPRSEFLVDAQGARRPHVAAIDERPHEQPVRWGSRVRIPSSAPRHQPFDQRRCIPPFESTVVLGLLGPNETPLQAALKIVRRSGPDTEQRPAMLTVSVQE